MVLLVSRCCWMTMNAAEFIVLGALFWTITFCPCAKADSNDLTDRFLREAPPKWKEYEDFAERLQGVMSHKYVENDKLVDNWRYEIKQNRNCKLVITRYLEAGPGSPYRKSTEKLNAYNPSYRFSLSRMTEGRPWMVSDYEQRTDANRADTEWLTRYEGTRIYTLVSVQPTVRLSDLVTRSSFHVLDAKSVQRKGSELMQVTFDNNHPVADSPPLPYCAVQSGILVLDPARSWYLVFADLQDQWANSKGRCTIENTISEMDSNRPIPKKSVTYAYLTLTNGKPLKQVITYECDLTAPTTLPEGKVFTLSAFGFPEPSFGSRGRWMSLDKWALISGIALIALAFFFRRFAKRKKSVA